MCQLAAALSQARSADAWPLCVGAIGPDTSLSVDALIRRCEAREY
jgi:hypothetical protein